MPTAPDRTPGQRIDALNLANDYRTARAQVCLSLATGKIDIGSVLTIGHRGTGDHILGRMHIGTTLRACPGWGRIKTTRLLTQLGINPLTHLDQLTHTNVTAIETAIDDAATKRITRDRP